MIKMFSLSEKGVKKFPNVAKMFDWLSMCTYCSNCGQFYEYGKERNFAAVNCPSGDYFKFSVYNGSISRNTLLKGLLSGRISLDDEAAKILFSCTLCGACQQMCETDVKDWILYIEEAARADVQRNSVGVPEGIQTWSKHIPLEHNPYIEKHSERLNWIPKSIRSSLPKKAEYVYFVGCTASYRQKNIALATIELLRKLNVDFTIVQDEWCCGSPLLRTGQFDRAKETALHNINVIGKHGDKIITTCAGCYRSLEKDYKKESPEGYKDLFETSFDMPVIHTIEVLDKAVKKGEVTFREDPRWAHKRVTYHDSCHIGRHCGIYEQPRDVLRAMPILFVEMERNRQWSFCCGAGGGIRGGMPEYSLETAMKRNQEAIEIKAEIMTSVCPFCYRNFSDAAKKWDMPLGVWDIIEIANETMIVDKR